MSWAKAIAFDKISMPRFSICGPPLPNGYLRWPLRHMLVRAEPVFGGLFPDEVFVPRKLPEAQQGRGREPNTPDQNTMDDIPTPEPDARRITGLVKESGKVTGYQLSDNTLVEKSKAVQLARQGRIIGVSIAHRGDTEYLKSIPDGSDSDNLSNLPSMISSER